MAHDPESSLSPWVHPKAQEWMEAIFKRSGLVENIENSVHRHAQDLTIDRLRALIATLILIGRPGVWPRDQLGNLRQIVQALIRQRMQLGTADSPQTVEGHQRRHQLLAILDEELDLLRRQTGVSRRVVPAQRPRTWTKFWQ